MFTRMTRLSIFRKVIVLQIIKAPSHSLTRSFLDAFRPMVITCYIRRGKGFKQISLTINSSNSTLHLRYGWNLLTKVIASAARVMCEKEFVLERYYIFHIIALVLVVGDDRPG